MLFIGVGDCILTHLGLKDCSCIMMCDICTVILSLHVKCEDGPNITITSDHLEVVTGPADEQYDLMQHPDIPKRDVNFGKPVGQGMSTCSIASLPLLRTCTRCSWRGAYNHRKNSKRARVKGSMYRKEGMPFVDYPFQLFMTKLLHV